MRRHVLAAMFLGGALSGCADPMIDDPNDPGIPTDDLGEVAAFDLAVNDESSLSSYEHDGAPESCESPADEGPCSLLCDPDALIENYVPEGTCVHFLCTLRDGTRRNVGACHGP